MGLGKTQFAYESGEETPRFHLRDFLHRRWSDLDAHEKGRLTPEQKEFIDAVGVVNETRFEHIYYAGEEGKDAAIRKDREIISNQLVMLAELADEMGEEMTHEGFHMSVNAQEYDERADTPGEVSVTLMRNGRSIATIYQKILGGALHDIMNDKRDKEHFRETIRGAIEKQERARTLRQAA